MCILKTFSKILRVFISVDLILFTIACSEDVTNKQDDDPIVEFSFSKSCIDIETCTDEVGNDSFIDGDKIDLYATSVSGERHFVLTMKNGQWIPKIYRKQLGEGDVVFTGYYPTTEPVQASSSAYHHAISSDQSLDESFIQSDLLRGSAQLENENLLVQMSFHHAMHRLKVNIKPQNGERLPKDLKVEVLSKRSGIISKDGNAAVDVDSEAEWITAHVMTDGWKTILFPQSTDPYKDQECVRISTGEKTSMFKLPSEINGKPFTQFKAGQEITVNLTLANQGGGEEDVFTLSFESNGGEGEISPKHLRCGGTTLLPDGTEYFKKFNSKFVGWNSSPEKGGIVEWRPGQNFTMPDHNITIYAVWRIVDLNIGGACEEFKGTTQWLKGITSPNQSEWVQVKGWDVKDGVYNKTVTAKPGCGWYDVSQGNLAMCWAAGASDILHYWMERNKEYLKRYNYNGPYKYDYKTGKSDIFNEFLPYWSHTSGGHAQVGFSWFLVGNSKKEGGAFFKEVFDEKVKVESVNGTGLNKAVSRKNFTEIITKAFKEDMAISMGMPSIGGSHQYIVWGAKYDNEGYVCGLYYVNPNDFNQRTISGEQIGLLYMDILYRDGCAFVKSSTGSDLPILSMAVCGIGQDVWEEYFRIHPYK